MPRYAFRCTGCGLEFDVSRPLRDAGAAATCPADGAAAERIFTVPSMNFNRPRSATPAPPSRGFSHSGHSHGPGTSHHTH
jgi:putative FmdB family regulatory protein